MTCAGEGNQRDIIIFNWIYPKLNSTRFTTTQIEGNKISEGKVCKRGKEYEE
jgi:hypothetical protein